ncbi:MAG: hypothetical protein GTN64_07950 [Candidatus Latescibacteria bacterium]|nr:hypothetical protein [Candidatus Latescibacterota bacterium]NIO78536.1 hypothetical protein [Candidatus Latescibacterota bacterium]NIT03057.1 hypothetical protein [Candidatus Latescibacterota bacterium]
MKRFFIFLLIAAIYVPVMSSSQERPGSGDRPTKGRRTRSLGKDSISVSARSSSYRDTLGERILELRDSVTIIRGNVTITARRGYQFTERRVTHLIGDVTIVQEGLRMKGEEGEYQRDSDRAVLKRYVRITDEGWNVTCDRAVLFRATDTAWLLGNVVASDSTTTLQADSVIYERDRLTAEAFGRVVVTNRAEGFTVKGDHGFYFRDVREGMVDRNPHLIVDLESPEPATVDSDTMRFFPDSRRAIAYGRVKILKGNTVTQCDSAAIFDEESRAELYGQPLAKQENVSMKGTAMVLRYTDDEVDRIHLLGDALIEEKQADSLIIGRDSWIRGDTMVLFLRDNRVDSIRVLGNCSSEYYPVPRSRVESNYATGNKMFFHFVKDTLDYVKITGSSDGIYRYLDLREEETSDSLRSEADTSLSYRPFSKHADKVVYSAKRIEYFAKEKDIVLEDDAEVVYQNRTLLGDRIVYHSTLQLLDATGSPILIEGGDKFYGEEMAYDLESGVGVVKDGSTKFMQGYYNGEEVAKVADNVMKVWNSTYTTCDLKVPHYHFATREMKVYLKDKAVSGPIWLYIGNTPIFGLPFLANNIQKDRRSGILRPEFEFGITKSTGRFIRNFGYYWATNDYTDFTFIGDFNEDASFRLFARNRYKLRYHFTGNVDFSFLRDLANYRNEWDISSSHSQTLGEKFDLTSDLRFVSSDAAPSAINRIDDVENVVNRRIESKVSVRKSWSSIGFSASARRIQNLNIANPDAVRIQTEFPSVSLSIPSRNLYFGRETKRGEKPFLEKLLSGVRYSPGVSGKRATEKKQFEDKEVINGNLSLNFSSPRKLGFVNISPSLSMNNNYTRTQVTIEEHEEEQADSMVLVPASHTVVSDNVFTWRTGGLMKTNFYGTFYPEVGSLIGIRHTVTPSVGYSYQPPISGLDSRQSFSVRMDNVLDLKVRSGEKERKLSGVMIWNLSSSYNPKAPERRGWSNVSSRVNLRLFGASVSMTQTIEPYEWQLTNTTITSSVSLHGTHRFGAIGQAAAPELNVIASDTTGGSAVIVERPEEPEEESFEPPVAGDSWNLSLAFSYSKSQFGDARSTLNANGSFQLTKNWKISYSTTYDVQNRMLMGQNFSINRDLHCWQMSFSRQKLGDEWQYYFRINVKAHQEIYAESGRRGVGRGGFGTPFDY